MLEKETLEEILKESLKYGADFSEIYIEDSQKDIIETIGNEVTNVISGEEYGVGIRLFKDLMEVYGYTNDLSKNNLLALSKSLGQSFMAEPLNIDINLKKKETVFMNAIHKTKKDFSVAKQIKMCLLANDVMLKYSTDIKQATSSLSVNHKNIIIANSNGIYKEEERNNIRFSSSAVASKNNVTQTGKDSYGYNSGYEIFDDFDVISFSNEIAKTAITMLNADEMIGGEMSVIVNNGFGGVILHEACAHSLEASSVAKNMSVFSGKMGKQIASDLVTAVDNGTIKNAWGSISFDDEGTKSKKNVLIENGILKGYMIDSINARRMKMDITGSARRESYKYSPTSRMTNTYIENGNSTFDEIIKNTKKALFAAKMGGGSVNPMTGEFNFSVLEGYMVVDGKITKPVRGATLVGNGSDVLMRVDMVGNNLLFGHGMCGASSGSIPTNVGQPTIRLTHMTVGGKGK